MADPTLKDLALAASQDPNNPAYLGPNRPNAGIPAALNFSKDTPEAAAPPADAEEAPVSAPLVVRPGGGTPATAPGMVSAPSLTRPGKAVPEELGKNNIMPTPLDVHGKPVGTKPAGGPAKPGEPSPERQELASYEEQGGNVLAALDAKEQSIIHQQQILQEGNDQANRLRQVQEAEQVAKQSEIDQFRLKAQTQANERDRQLEERAQLMRQGIDPDSIINPQVIKNKDGSTTVIPGSSKKLEVDPNKWFKDRGVAGSILAAISIGAGAFAAAMPHTANHENQALNIINAAIDRDVDKQKGDIALKWKELDRQGNVNDKQYVRDQYTLNKMQEAKVIALSHTNALIEDGIRSTNNQSAIAGMQDLRTQVQLERSKTVNDMANHRLQVQLKERAQQAAAAGANPYSDLNMRKAYNDYYKITTDAGKPAMGYNEWATGKLGAGAAGKGSTPASMASQIAVGDQIAANLGKMKALLAGPMTSETIGAYEALHAQTIAMTAKDTTGRFNEAEAKILRDSLPSGYGAKAMVSNTLPYVGPRDMAALDALQKSVIEENNRRKTLGAGATEDVTPTEVPGATLGLKR